MPTLVLLQRRLDERNCRHYQRKGDDAEGSTHHFFDTELLSYYIFESKSRACGTEVDANREAKIAALYHAREFATFGSGMRADNLCQPRQSALRFKSTNTLWSFSHC
jgi:hypothetical protein